MDHQQINAHVDANLPTIAEAQKQQNLSKVLEIAMPILRFLSSFIFIPAKWRTVITAIVATYDSMQMLPK